MATLDMLCAISPLDGRYGSKVEELRGVFSEYGLVKRRIAVECAWLAALCANPELPEFPEHRFSDNHFFWNRAVCPL